MLTFDCLHKFTPCHEAAETRRAIPDNLEILSCMPSHCKLFAITQHHGNLLLFYFILSQKEPCVTSADVDDFPVLDLECSQPLLNGASAFVGKNSEKLVCIPEATFIDTEDVTDLSCSHDDIRVKTCQPTGMCEKGTQRPLASSVPYKELCERRKLECRSEVIDTMNNAALKFVCYEKKYVPDFINETVKSKKWSTTFWAFF